MAELKNLFSEYLDTWCQSIIYRTKVIFFPVSTKATRSQDDISVLTSKLKELTSKLDEIEKKLAKSQFVISIPFKNNIETAVNLLHSSQNSTLSKALSTQSGAIYETAISLNSLLKFLQLKKHKIVEFNVLTNVMLPHKDKSVLASFIRQDVKTHKILQQEELKHLIIELGFFIDDKSFYCRQLPAVYSTGKQLFICTEEQLKKLKTLDASIKTTISKMQEQIALANVGSSDSVKYEEYQKEYLSLTNEKETVLSTLKQYQPPNQD